MPELYRQIEYKDLEVEYEVSATVKRSEEVGGSYGDYQHETIISYKVNCDLSIVNAYKKEAILEVILTDKEHNEVLDLINKDFKQNQYDIENELIEDTF